MWVVEIGGGNAIWAEEETKRKLCCWLYCYCFHRSLWSASEVIVSVQCVRLVLEEDDGIKEEVE